MCVFFCVYSMCVCICVCVCVTCVYVCVPALSLHAGHSQVLPAGVQQVHLLSHLRLLPLTQIPLPQEGGASTQDTPHATLVRRQLHHVTLATHTHRKNTHINMVHTIVDLCVFVVGCVCCVCHPLYLVSVKLLLHFLHLGGDGGLGLEAVLR